MRPTVKDMAMSWSGQSDRPLDVLARGMEPDHTVGYKTVGGRSLHLHVFTPEGHRTTDRRPLYVTFHGGGWAGRTPRYFYPFAQHFADIGMVGISVEYRLFDPQLYGPSTCCISRGNTAGPRQSGRYCCSCTEPATVAAVVACASFAVYRSPLHRLYGATLWRLPWIAKLNKWVHRMLGVPE